MPRKDVCRWIPYFMQHLHQTQAKTLAEELVEENWG